MADPLQIAREALEKAEQKFLFYAEQHAAITQVAVGDGHRAIHRDQDRSS